MHIAHVINNLNKGGAERLLVEVLPLLKQRGVTITVLQLSSLHSEKEYIQILENQGISVAQLSDKDSVYSPVHILRLKKFLSKHSFDIIHAHLFPTMYFMGLVKKMGIKTPIVFTEHSTQNRRLEKKYLQPIERFIYRSFERIIAISPIIQQKLIDWTRLKDRVALIRNGVDTHLFSSALAYGKAEVKNIINVGEDVRLLMMTARFVYPKDHKTVVNALQHLPANYHVVFAGGIGDMQSIIDYVEDKKLSDRVHFIGFRTDVARLMKSVDVNVLSSFYEGMSGVTCEALAAGKPFLGADVPGINDVVPDERFLFECGNEKDLAAKIIQIVNDASYAQMLVSEGLLHVRQFDIDKMVDKHIELYKNVLKA